VNGSGNVGIGTSPDYRLDVFQSLPSAYGTIRIYNPDSTGGSQLMARSNAGGLNLSAHGSAFAGQRFGVPLAGLSEILSHSGATGLAIGTNGQAPLILGTNSANRIHITSDGNIGVGTTSPTANIHVFKTGGAATFENLLTLERASGGPPGILFLDGANNHGWQFRMTSGGNFRLTDTDGAGTDDGVTEFDLQTGGNLILSGGVTATSAVTTLNKIISADTTLYDIATTTRSDQDVAAGRTNSGYAMGIDTRGSLTGAGILSTTVGIRSVAGTETTSSGTVQTAYGAIFRVRNGGAANGSSIQTGYGLYLGDVEANNGYGIYQLGSDDKNYFAGNVGIGTNAPTEKLHVVGNATVSGNFTAGNIAAKYQDVAEWVPTTESLAPGTVVVIEVSATNHVVASSRAYDTGVAGVISAQPGLVLGEGGDGKTMVATTGRVRIRVDATSNPIKAGDILVTSDKPGTAMKSVPVDIAGIQFHRPGTVVGKALEALPDGEGEILVLLSLQ
jgi:hypothetical protein